MYVPCLHDFNKAHLLNKLAVFTCQQTNQVLLHIPSGNLTWLLKMAIYSEFSIKNGDFP